METITVPKAEFELMRTELELLRNSKIYQRLLEFEQNIAHKKLTRKNLGF